jgi:hypothetical protein
VGDKLPIPPDAVTTSVFQDWRAPRRGTGNPELMNNPLWEWLIESRLGAFQANEILKGPWSLSDGPMWCFSRYGQSTTILPDGRNVLIAGEHEDHYDPDFYIYNDVVVADGSGGRVIYGYPSEVFPPTDFHSASLTGSHIVLIGNLGYPEDRRVGQTQVLAIECETWSVSRIDTIGQSPGWIHDHCANPSQDGASVLITGGKILWSEDRQFAENIDEWLLHLPERRWERLSQRRWPRFEVYRADRKRNHLFELRMEQFAREMGLSDLVSTRLKLESEFGGPPPLDLVPLLYAPPVHYEPLPRSEDEFRVHRIRVDGTVVRYVEDSHTVQVTIEGGLAAQIVDQLRQDLTRKLENIEKTPMTCQEIPL